MPLQTHWKDEQGEERQELKWAWSAKREQSIFFPPFCSGVGALWVSVLIQPLWSMEPLIWTKIREFDPLFLKRWHTGVVFMVIKKSFWLKINGRFQMGLLLLGVKCIFSGCVSVPPECLSDKLLAKEIIILTQGQQQWQQVDGVIS